MNTLDGAVNETDMEPAASPTPLHMTTETAQALKFEAGTGYCESVSKVSVQPSFVARVAGLPTRALTGLRDPSLSAHVDTIDDCNAALTTIGLGLANALHDVVPSLANDGLRRQVLAVRRKLYNVADLAEPDSLLVGRVTGNVTHRELESYEAWGEQRRRLTADIAAVYQLALLKSRQAMQASLRSDTIMLSLSVASPDALFGVNRYLSMDANALRSRDRQVERGLLRYLTRATAKATPFSQFCFVVPGLLSGRGSGTNGRAQLIGNVDSKQAHVRVNKSLITPLWMRLLQSAAVKDGLKVSLNHSLVASSGQLSFVGKQGAFEVVHKVPRSDVLEAVLDLTRGRAQTHLSLINELVTHPRIDATRDEARAYIERLLTLGLLHLNVTFSDHDEEWANGLRDRIAGIDEPIVAETCELLEALESSRRRFGGSPSGERAELVADAKSRISAFVAPLEGAQHGAVGTPFFEDATMAASLRLEATPEIQRALSSLCELFSLTRECSWPRDEQATMRHYFDQRYGGEVGAVPLLRFYEDFSRDHLKEHDERLRLGAHSPSPTASDAISNPFNLAVISERQEAAAAWGRLIWSRLAEAPEAEEMSLSRSDLECAFGKLARAVPERLSLNVFCHFVPPDHQRTTWRIVLSKPCAFTGYGKYYSRFLHMFTENVTRSLLGARHEEAGVRVAEVIQSSDFNANIRPRVLPWDIAYPTESSESPASMSCADLDVSPDPQSGYRLQLTHRVSGERVLPIDSSFMNPLMRPALFQLLARFQPAASLLIPTRPRRDAVVNSDGGFAPARAQLAATRVQYSPRITYENAVVLQRRSWQLPLADLAAPGGESDEECFMRLHRWRIHHGVPRQIFLKLLPRVSSPLPVTPGEEAPKAKPAVNRALHDFKKPQFVDFESPLLVQLFASIVRSLPDYTASLEECLPDLEQGCEVEGARYAWEAVLQLNGL